MKSETHMSDVAREYATAYAAHYAARDLPSALQRYREIVTSHPGTPEAEFSRMQIQNIAHAVVPKQELLDAQVDLVLARFDDDRPLDGGRSVPTPVAAVQPL